jgi:CubicO group peptidase (beta-lactamase class C family)
LKKRLGAALDYIPRWIDYQMRLTEQPGCALAVVSRGQLVLEAAFGHADLDRGTALTPRHRFRVASHSKTFTAAGVLKLREAGRLRLDDPVGRHVGGLHPVIGEATINQLLSHSAGLTRDGVDTGQWVDRRAFLDADEIRAELGRGTAIDANTRFKYSNLGFGLIGMAMESITGERYAEWIAREIVAASGLEETAPDVPLDPAAPFARGHGGKLPLGRRVVIPGENPTRGLAAATGFVSTAADLARFYASLAPQARRSVLSVASRREMTRRQWRDAQTASERWYGLGTISGSVGDWDWFGHSGGFQGYITRTLAVPSQELAISVLTNATDGLSHAWLDGTLHILRGFAQHGAPTRTTAGWNGRWWTLWGATDLVPAAERVFVVNPSQPNPFLDASELEVGRRRGLAPDFARISQAPGLASHGETARLLRDARGRPKELWLAGSKLLPEAQVARELERRYPRA